MNKNILLLFIILLSTGSVFASDPIILDVSTYKKSLSSEHAQTSKKLPDGMTYEQMRQMEQKRANFEYAINLTPEQRNKIKEMQVKTNTDVARIQKEAAPEISEVYNPEQPKSIQEMKNDNQ